MTLSSWRKCSCLRKSVRWIWAEVESPSTELPHLPRRFQLVRLPVARILENWLCEAWRWARMGGTNAHGLHL